MPRVDFYILSDPAPNGRALLACRLAEKAYALGHKVYLHTPSAEQARTLDELLWTFRQGSFIPHALCPAGESVAPVLIGWGGDPGVDAEVLINLTDEAPAFFERFERVAEIAAPDPRSLSTSRERFRFYRKQGCPPASHKL